VTVTLRFFRDVPLLLGSILVLAACEHAAVLDPIEPDEPTLTAVQARIFSQGCALSGCHAGSAAPMGLDLREGFAFSHTVNVPSLQVPALMRVAPGNPDASYLVMKVEGSEGIVGSRMPLGMSPLPQRDLDLLRAWILAGALDD